MSVRVKLFGTLSQHFSCYNPEHGIEVEILDDVGFKDLLACLGISESQEGIVAMNGRIMNADDKLKDGACVNILYPVFGG